MAAPTFGYASTGITVHRGIDRFSSTILSPTGYCDAPSPGDCASGTSCAMSHWIKAWILLSIW